MNFVDRYRPLLYVGWLGARGSYRPRRCWTNFWEELQLELKVTNKFHPWQLITPDLFHTYANFRGEDAALTKVLEWRWFDVSACISPRLRSDVEVRLAFEAILTTNNVFEAYSYVVRQEGLVVRVKDGCTVVTSEAGGPVNRVLEG